MIVFMIGLVFGCAFVFFLYGVIDRLVFSKLLDDPVKGKLASIVVAWLIAGTLLALVSPQQTAGSLLAPYIVFIVPAVLIGIYAYRRGLAIRKAQTVDVSIFE
jgi:uncharacterized membrane protein